ncbi:MAG: hypothetical protein AAGA42_17440 [Actinomycetota bacterium]
MHKPSEIDLFTAKEQTLLVSTEPDRLDKLTEDELADLVPLVRKGRNKYRDLDVRQSRAAMQKAGRRSVSRTSNQRTLRKAEIFEDALSRVSRYLSRAARASANELRAARIEAARNEREAARAGKAKGSGKVGTPSEQKTASKRGRASEPTIAGSRRGSTSKQGKSAQAKKDTRKSKK